MADLDLLNPENLKRQYAHLLEQTINAYDAPHIVLGEALQNALDAVFLAGNNGRSIKLGIDFNQRSITVADDGVGFPNDPTLLFLGGSKKSGGDRNLYGMIGAGLKVVLFSSSSFALRANTGDSVHAVTIADACRFAEDDPPALMVPDEFPVDPDPLDARGTELEYGFPEEAEGVFDRCFTRILEATLPQGALDPFFGTLSGAVEHGGLPCRLAALLSVYLRRFTYVGDAQAALGLREDLEAVTIDVTVRCDLDGHRPHGLLGELFDDQSDFTFAVAPRYASVADTREWVRPRTPPIYADALGRGGRNLQTTASGFNVLTYTTPAEYESLLVSARGNIDGDARVYLEEFQNHLFPRINGIALAIGRIPEFHRCLPGGSRRLISANGVATAHDLDFTKGRNQEYVRCFDLLIDVDAQLNYGKTQVTDMHLVNRIRRFADQAYRATIQNAAALWVGRIEPDGDDDEHDVFLGRTDLGLPDYVLAKEPTSEQDVIALFFELAGHGVFPDYRVYGLSSKDKYDSRAAILREGQNPDEIFNPRDERDLKVVEFKKSAAQIVTDLERYQKDAGEIDLLVAWDEGVPSIPRYVFEDIEHSEAFARNPKRVYPPAQRYLHDTRTGRQVQVLLLSRVVETLRPPANEDEALGESETGAEEA